MKIDGHFIVSMVKSFIRVLAGIVFIYGGITLPYDIMIYAGALLIAAELLGVAEEMV